ncbi:MAG: M16 family metallopeptidase [Candidatus Krumholzibacteriia bacterium]
MSNPTIRRPRPAPRLAALAAPTLLAVLLAAAWALPAAAAKEAQAPVVDLKFEKYTLPNGLDVILRRDNRLPLVAVNIWYHVGPANEVAGRTGFAHLFEHMMFQASGHVEEDRFWSILEGAGASFINGSTDFDRTNYLEDVPSNQLETALWLESDRMGFLLDRLDAQMLARQQEVVRNERRQGVENQPYGLVEEALYHLVFPAGHPYHANVIGSHADIQAATPADVRDFFRRYYAPNNASLVIVGDIDVAKTKALVTKYFATIARGPAVPPITAVTPPITSERREIVTDKVELPRIYIAWLTAPYYKPGDAEADLASRVLAGGKASRLYKSLVYDRKIAQDVSARQQSLALGSMFQIIATAKPGHTAEELERAIDAELAKLAAEGPTAAEVDAARNMIWTATVTSLENLGAFSGVADRLNQYNQYLGDPGKLNWDLARYARVTPDAIRAFAADELRRDRRVVVYGVPGEQVVPPGPPAPASPPPPTEPVVSAEPWRDTQPTPGPASLAPLPAAARFTLANGLPVYLVEAHNLPVVAAHLVVRAGSAADPAGRGGLAGFTAAMLDEGAGARDALGISRELEANGASLFTNSSADGSYVSGVALAQNAGALLDVMSDVVLRPTFPAGEIDRVRNDRLTALLQQRDNPFQIAMRVLPLISYGGAHPYGHSTLGDETSLKAISRDDLAGFYGSTFAPANAALVFAGDLTEAQARTLAEKAFGAWNGRADAVVRPGAPSPLPQRLALVDKPGATQTAVLFGEVTIARDDPDFEPLNVMNMVLGSLFSSRLNMNLREDKGITYGAFSSLQERRGAAPLFGGAMVQADKTGLAVSESFKELRGMLAAEMTPQELTLARDAIVRALPAAFETTASTVGTIGSLFLYDQPPDYYQTLPAELAKLDAAGILAATRRHLDPAQMRVVLVGDRSLIEPQLGDLELGAPALYDADGRPLDAGR